MKGLEELIEETEKGVAFYVQVQPKAGKTQVVGRHGGAVKLTVAAPPLGGRANEAVVAFLARTLGVDQESVRIVQGSASRKKRIEVAGIERGLAVKLLEAAGAKPRTPRK